MSKTKKPLTNAERQARFRERREAQYSAQPEASFRREMATRLRTLHREIGARRKANHDERQKSRWNPDGILKRQQTELLDWIETQLDALEGVAKDTGGVT